MARLSLLVAISALLEFQACVAEDMKYQLTPYYLAHDCDGAPNRVDAEVCGSALSECTSTLYRAWGSASYNSSTDYKELLDEIYEGVGYVLVEAFEEDCTTLRDAIAFPGFGGCEQILSGEQRNGTAVYVLAQLTSSGSLDIRYFTDSECLLPLQKSVALTRYIQAEDSEVAPTQLNSRECDDHYYSWSYYSASRADSHSYSSSDDVESEGELNSTAINAGIAGGVLVVVLTVLGYLYYRRSKAKRTGNVKQHGGTRSSDYLYQDSPSMDQQRRSSLNDTRLNEDPPGKAGLWTDEIITAKRISRQEVGIEQLLSRGVPGFKTNASR